MLKTLTIAAIAVATAVAIPPLHAHEFGIQLNVPNCLAYPSTVPS
jgi:hypothetical protein